MPSALYSRLLATVTDYIGADKAVSVIQRQLKRCDGATPETFSKSDLNRLVLYLVLATTLYVPDKARAAELEARLKALG